MEIQVDNYKTPVVAKSNDYKDKDGYLCCGKCHTRKEYRHLMPNGTTFVTGVLCSCKAKQRQGESLRTRIDKLKAQVFPHSNFLEKTFNTMEENCVVNKAKKYVENFEEFKQDGQGLIIYGNYGCGKTHLAACIANALTEKEVICKFTDFPTIIDELWDSEDKTTYLTNLLHCDLLIIDDFGTERKTDYAKEVVFKVINARYNQNLPLIITTNIDYRTIANMQTDDIIEKRIYDRLFEKCIGIHMDGNNKRRQNLMSKAKKYKELLGNE